MTSSDNQGRSMELLNKFAEELQNAANETSSQMDVLAELIKKTNEDGNTAKELMTESVELSQSGRSAIVESADTMNTNVVNVAENSKIVAESAEELKKESVSLMEKMSTFKIEA